MLNQLEPPKEEQHDREMEELIGEADEDEDPFLTNHLFRENRSKNEETLGKAYKVHY